MAKTDATKETFLTTWIGGYRENWEVYGKMSGQAEDTVVKKCLSHFYDKNKICLEIGCGLAFWTDRYLAENFKEVIAIDILPRKDFEKVVLKNKNIKYIEVPDRNFDCYGVDDNSIDFVWSFGVFCHLSLEACQEYLNSMYKKCKAGAQVALYYSNNDRRPLPKNHVFDGSAGVPWERNTFQITKDMLDKAGFIQIYDLMPELPDTMISGTKPV